MSQESGIAVSSLKNYYQVLVDTFLGYWLHSYKKSSRRRLVTTPAFYFFDLGVRNAAAEIKLNETLLSTVGGPLLEDLVGLELIQKATYMGRGYRASFWRTMSGAEVDFIFETPQEDAGASFLWQTGTPITELGIFPSIFPVFYFISKRGSTGRTPALTDLNVRLKYDLGRLASRGFNASLILDGLHLLNQRNVTEVDQVHFQTVDENDNPIAPNPNYLSPVGFEPARAVQLGMEVKF